MPRPARDEITITFDPFAFSPFPGGEAWGGEAARALMDVQLRLAQAVMRAAWEAQSDFLRATAAAVLDAQARLASSLPRTIR